MSVDASTTSGEGSADPFEDTKTDSEIEYRQSYVDRITLSRALVAGVVGGVFFGIPLQFVIGRMAAIGAMYTFGTASIPVGWAAHLGHSAVFGVVFGMATELDPLHSWMERNVGIAAVVGIAFAVCLYAFNIVLAWPVWLQAVGYTPAFSWSIPHTPLAPFLGHLLWGAITGTVFHYLVDY